MSVACLIYFPHHFCFTLPCTLILNIRSLVLITFPLINVPLGFKLSLAYTVGYTLLRHNPADSFVLKKKHTVLSLAKADNLAEKAAT